MNMVGIFRLNFPEVPETFIRAQLSAYQRYRPQVFAKRRLADSAWPVSSVSDYGAWAERLFVTTRSTRWHRQDNMVVPKLLHAHFGVDGVYALPLARRLGIPLITTFHGFDILTKPTAWLKHPTIPTAMYRLHLRDLMSSGARFVAVSRFVEKALIDAGFPRERVIQHYIGIDTQKFCPASHQGQRDSRYVLSVGRHVDCKGIDILLMAFARIASRHPAVKLLQVGSGPRTDDLKQLAAELGISHRVEFLGAQAHEKVLSLMQGAEAFALPCLTQSNGQSEALGIVFNEASACGLPIASTISGGIPEAVIHGETGLLCAERDDKALANNLDHLLGDTSLRQVLGRAGRALVCDRFDITRQTNKLEQVYDEVTV